MKRNLLAVLLEARKFAPGIQKKDGFGRPRITEVDPGIQKKLNGQSGSWNVASKNWFLPPSEQYSLLRSEDLYNYTKKYYKYPARQVKRRNRKAITIIKMNLPFWKFALAPLLPSSRWNRCGTWGAEASPPEHFCEIST
eukprot:scaffold2429_cov106-Cylindrotheca_fusiformis.AAC.2